VCTRPNGVTAFADRLAVLGLDARAFVRAQVAAIGSATAGSLAERQLIPDLVPTEDMHSERLAELLTERCRGGRVLLAQAVQARALLRDVLAAGATADVAPVYEQVVSIDGTEEVFDRLRRGEVDAVTLTSPNIAAAFLGACDESIRQRFCDGTTKLVVNSDRLAKVLEAEGLPSVVAPDPTVEGLISALRTLVTR